MPSALKSPAKRRHHLAHKRQRQLLRLLARQVFARERDRVVGRERAPATLVSKQGVETQPAALGQSGARRPGRSDSPLRSSPLPEHQIDIEVRSHRRSAEAVVVEKVERFGQQARPKPRPLPKSIVQRRRRSSQPAEKEATGWFNTVNDRADQVVGVVRAAA